MTPDEQERRAIEEEGLVGAPPFEPPHVCTKVDPMAELTDEEAARLYALRTTRRRP